MDWIFDNIWVVIAIAAVIAKVVQATRGQKSGASGEPPPPAKEYEFKDPELAERTRKIREEIQRKIAERRGQYTQPAAPLSPRPTITAAERSAEATTPPAGTLPNILLEVLQSKLEPVRAPVPPRTLVPAEAERPADLMDRLRASEAIRAAAATERRIASAAAAADREGPALQAARAAVLEDLGSPAALRRAFVLREVLGPPVALR